MLPLHARFLPAYAIVLGVTLAPSTAPAAEPAATPVAGSGAQAEDSAGPRSRSSLAGFSVLAMGGWGASTYTIRHLDLATYGATFGLDAHYTFRIGFSVGAYFDYSLGGAKPQHRDPLIGRTIDFTADASSLHGGVTVGWDVPLHPLVLRYTLGFGVTSMKWDFGSAPKTIIQYQSWSNPIVGFHFLPGLALLYQSGLFEGGAGFDYFVQTGAIPAGFLGKVLVGVKF